MKTNMTRKFTLALASFMVASVALTSATFAWFTQAGNAQVDEFNLNVSAAPGLKIGLKLTDKTLTAEPLVTILSKYGTTGQVAGDIVYFTSLTNTIINDFFGAPIDTVLEPRTTNLVDAVPAPTYYLNPKVLETDPDEYTYLPDMFELVNNNEIPQQAADGFYQMEIYLYSQETKTVKLKDFATNGVNVLSTGLIGDQAEVINAARIGFGGGALSTEWRVFALEDDFVEPAVGDHNVSTQLWGPLDLDGNGYYDFAPATDFPIDATLTLGSGNREIIYGHDVVVNHYTNTHPLETPATSAFTAGRDTTTYTALASDGTTSTASGLTQTAHDNGFQWNITAETDYRLTITIWLEGWDLDCVNEIGLSNFKINIQFSGN